MLPSRSLLLSLIVILVICTLVYVWYIFGKWRAEKRRARQQQIQSRQQEIAQVKLEVESQENDPVIRGAVPNIEKPPLVTEKTRQELMKLVSDLKSVRQDSSLAHLPTTNVSEEELSSTDLIAALADTLISKVETDGEDLDKRSKLSIDGSLLFDAEEVEFFEREFGSNES